MKNKKWNEFDKLTEKCYENMIGAEKDGSCWVQAFEVLKEILMEERQKNPEFATELELLDETTDYAHEVEGWLEDCLDEVDMRGQYEVLLQMCNDLLCMFNWTEYSASDIKFRKSSALGSLGRNKEAKDFCEEWMKKEEHNIVAATAFIYACIKTKEYEKAQEVVERFIQDQTNCTEENDIMFMAASKLYEVMGKKKEKRQIDKAMDEYEKALEEYLEGGYLDGDEFAFFDDDLPF